MTNAQVASCVYSVTFTLNMEPFMFLWHSPFYLRGMEAVEIVRGVTQPVCVPPAETNSTPCVIEGRNAQRDSGKRRLSDVDVRQAAFILTEGRTVTQSILPLRLSPIQCFSLFSSFTLEVFCYSALKRHFKKKRKNRWHSRSVERSWLHAARQRSTKPSDWN